MRHALIKQVLGTLAAGCAFGAAAPAAVAQTAVLLCSSPSTPAAPVDFEYRLDYGAKTITATSSAGNLIFTAPVQIAETEITWTSASGTGLHAFRLDRFSGELRIDGMARSVCKPGAAKF